MDINAIIKTLDLRGGNYAKQTPNSKNCKAGIPIRYVYIWRTKTTSQNTNAGYYERSRANPDITYQEAAAHYIDPAELASVNEQPHLPKRIGILIGITLVIIVLCILLYVISNQFTPPTYYF